MPADLETGRLAYDQHDWPRAYEYLRGAEEPEDIQRLAVAAQLAGYEEAAIEQLQRAHSAFLKRGDLEPAIRAGGQLAMYLLNRGEFAQAGGWLARSRRLLDELNRDSAEAGFLMIPAALQALEQGDVAQASRIFEQVIEIAERFEDADLGAMGRLGRGQSLVITGQLAAGLELFDETMVAVTSGEVSPIVSGIIYCAVIDGCRRIYDLRRAQEWTEALDHWCESQPGLVPFRGNCLVFRSQIKQFHGAWADALSEADRACALLTKPRVQSAAGDAFYQLGELHRLRGDYAKADAAYQQANDTGRSPQPGLALVRLAKGQIEAAAAAVRRERDEEGDPSRRCAVLPAYVEVMVAAGDVDAARDGAGELARLADMFGAPYVRAIAGYADGAVLLAAGDPKSALESLRRALKLWRELGAPYEVARTRELIASACGALGDSESAEMELAAARKSLGQLGAVVAVHEQAPAPGGLSTRELDVLRLLAAGKTNKAIAADLFISEKTVARHVSNIFDKLGLASRAAATAYAYEHGLHRRPT
ncbi:MAG TPA: LuxR C-terminal-related transcriptional regulator [Candidatus Dormibacteraeota bacterium]